MDRIAYSVIATLPDATTASEYTKWLADGHVQAVLAGGALSAEVVRMEDPAGKFQVESRYVFGSRAAFERYLRETAPGLRAQGLARYPASRGVTFERRIGTLAWEGTQP